ncbi:MAG: peptidase M23, partial [Pseudomonadota bacterium]
MKRCILLTVLFLSVATAMVSGGTGMSSSNAAVTHEAHLAVRQLEEANQMLSEAKDAQNRVRALTQTVRAYEAGLAVLGSGMEQAELREAELKNALERREKEVANLLGVLSTIERDSVLSSLVHPAGALATARAGMMLADVTPALEQKAETLRSDLKDLQDLAALQSLASERLVLALNEAELARAALNNALKTQSDLPRRFSEDPVKTALLLAASETLTEFAASLDIIATSVVSGSLPEITDRRGRLHLPVTEAAVEHRSGAASPPALRLSTPHKALVTTPVPATLRYRGPLLDYGNVVIVEPQQGILIVMAGLETVFGEIGQV